MAMMHNKALSLLVMACLAAARAAEAKLSISDGRLLDDGRPVVMHGVNWFGFNNKQTAPDGLWGGPSSLVKDVSSVIYRQQLLGFNAVRLPFSFKDFALPGRTDFAQCIVASPEELRRSVTPPGAAIPATKPLPPPRLPLTVASDGRCNVGMPANTYERLLHVVGLYARAGFYVLLDNHVWLEDPTAYESPQQWADLWQKLVGDVARDPVAKPRTLFDLANEPDNKRIFWRPRDGRPGLAALYQLALPKVFQANPEAVVVLEGTGQIGYAVPSGDGFVTDKEVIRSFATKRTATKSYTITGIEDPNFFFEWLMAQPFAGRVAFGPHVYHQSVIPFELPKAYMEPPGLYKRLSDSFGYLTKKGYCGGSGCRRFPVLIGEFSAPTGAGAAVDAAGANGLVLYMNDEGAGADGRHAKINMWFYWAWNHNTPDTNGGIVKENWLDVDWEKIAYLRRLGLTPWFAK